jgi:hypothetical protein
MEQIAIELIGKLDGWQALTALMLMVLFYLFFKDMKNTRNTNKRVDIRNEQIANLTNWKEEFEKIFGTHISQQIAFEMKMDKKLDDIHEKVNDSNKSIEYIRGRCSAIHGEKK